MLLILRVFAADRRLVGRSGNDDEGERAGHLTGSITDVVNGLALQFEPIDLEHFIAGEQLGAPLGGASFDHPADDDAFTLVANRGSQRLILLHNLHHSSHISGMRWRGLWL